MGYVYNSAKYLLNTLNGTSLGIAVILILIVVLYEIIKKRCRLLQKDNLSDQQKNKANHHKGSRGIRDETRSFSPHDTDENNSEDLDDESITNDIDVNIIVPAEDLVPQIPFQPEIYSEEEMQRKSENFYLKMKARRSCRFISPRHVPIEIIKNIMLTAGTSPSGAHTQPWTYAVISNEHLKAEIRKVIETEEEINYKRRMGKTWVYDVQTKTQTTWVKPYLEEAPYIIIILKKVYGIGENNEKINYYYNEISTSISVGIMLAAIQNAGLVTVTTTPLNAGPTLRQMLQRPINEKVLVLLPVGYATKEATVPDLKRHPIENIMKLYD